MADIELVIKIPEEVYDFTKSAKTARTYNAEYYVNLILNGKPLPKGHGRLIDADKINFDSNYFYNGDDTIIAEETINDIPTIIDADKENKQ